MSKSVGDDAVDIVASYQEINEDITQSSDPGVLGQGLDKLIKFKVESCNEADTDNVIHKNIGEHHSSNNQVANVKCYLKSEKSRVANASKNYYIILPLPFCLK